jgi:hypothetical protein
MAQVPPPPPLPPPPPPPSPPTPPPFLLPSSFLNPMRSCFPFANSPSRSQMGAKSSKGSLKSPTPLSSSSSELPTPFSAPLSSSSSELPTPFSAPLSSSSSELPTLLSFADCLTGRAVSLLLVADDKLLSPSQLRAQIKRPLELIKAEAHFAQRSPRCKHLRQEALPPLDSIFAEYPPCVQLRLMSRCVAIAFQRLATAPAGMHTTFMSWGWTELVMERVTRARVRRVQVRRVCCAVRCACPASACVLCVFNARCSKCWLVFQVRCRAAQRPHQAHRGIHSCVQVAAAARVADGPDILVSSSKGNGASVLCHLIADACGVKKQDQ